MNPVLNLAAYHFCAIAEPESVRTLLQSEAERIDIKGTILISQEGLNAFLAGSEFACREMLKVLRSIPGLEALQAKESWSAAMPFRRLKIKVKPEIIRMDQPAIRPSAGRAPAVDPKTLARWLDTGHDDDGRPVVMLDTRNDVEVDCGHFENTIDWRIRKFTEFPAALSAHKEELRGKTVVSYCTGGIRCEKAAIFMQNEGVEHVYQLDGGILKYFEETDGRHYRGACFVFDERGTVDTKLQPAPRSESKARSPRVGVSPSLSPRPSESE
ncbi:MAG: sulfurtransferase [Betaproteobacteria bacterium]|nr:sulfurtransferase [Betaproteobacteria bacterium]